MNIILIFLNWKEVWKNFDFIRDTLSIGGTKKSRSTDYLCRSFHRCRRGEEIRRSFENLLRHTRDVARLTA